MRSLGHLSATSLKPSFSRARTTATPTASDRPARNPAPCSNFHPSENVRLPPAMAVHVRPRRPRPADCLGAEREDVSYRELARTLGVAETSVKRLLHQLRVRYRELLREEVAQTVENPGEIDEELRYLCAALSTAS